MSAFLGPIHTWLFNKIKLQNDMTENILAMAAKNGYEEGISLLMDQRYGRLEEGELADIIDGTNIHGWLQERIAVVESRLAFAVTAFTANHAERLDDICCIAEELGRKNQVQPGISVREAYNYLDGILLNGMPCDHVNVLETENEQELVWAQTTDIHESYWSLVCGDINKYYTIRESLIKGLLENSDVSFKALGGQRFELKKEA